jgi:hypothetical protein
MTYSFAQEGFSDCYDDLEPLYRAHYAEMCERLTAAGQVCSPYNPRLDIYRASEARGDLITLVLRSDGEAVGYINVYVTNDMHNMDRIAKEDTVFVRKDHRKGIGKKLVEYGLDRTQAAQREAFDVSAMTDLRVAKVMAADGV